MDKLTEIIRARLNLIEGNMTWDEYSAWEQKRGNDAENNARRARL